MSGMAIPKNKFGNQYAAAVHSKTDEPFGSASVYNKFIAPDHRAIKLGGLFGNIHIYTCMIT